MTTGTTLNGRHVLTACGAAMLFLCSCSSADKADPNLPTKDAPDVETVKAVFQRYQAALPSPQTLSEGNGISLECPKHGVVTYTLLSSLARKLPVNSDKGLLELVPWCRDPDPCLRYMALEHLAEKNGYTKGRSLTVPCMFDLEHWMFYENILETKAYLDRKGVRYAPALFADTLPDLKEKDFLAWAEGRWEEDVDKTHTNFYDVITLKEGTVHVTQIHTGDDPQRPDHTWTTRIKSVEGNERRQFVIRGEWNEESDAKGFRGKRVEPSQFTYVFWPMKGDVMWFGHHGRNDWKKFRKIDKANPGPEVEQALRKAFGQLRVEGKIPQDGFERIREAIRASKPDAKVLFVNVSDEYDLLLLRSSRQAENDWALSRSVLLRNRPSLKEGFNPDDPKLVKPLLRYYGSEWLRQKVQADRKDAGKGFADEQAHRYLADLLWSNSPPRKEANGDLTYETGPAQIAGDGLHITITPKGDLVAVKWVHNPD